MNSANRFFPFELSGNLPVAYSIPSITRISLINKLIKTSEILRKRWRLSMITRSIGINEKIGFWQQLKRTLLFFGNWAFSVISLTDLAPFIGSVSDHCKVMSNRCSLGHLHQMLANFDVALSRPQTVSKNFQSLPKNIMTL